MQKKLLRSVLATTFSAVMAFGAVSAFSAAKSDVRADSAWLVKAEAAPAGDSAWSADDSAWSVGS